MRFAQKQKKKKNQVLSAKNKEWREYVYVAFDFPQ